MKIPILDLTQEIEFLWDNLNEKMQEVLRSGNFILGETVRLLETELAQYLRVKHAIGLNSGTDALLISLRALDIKEGDEVITTPFTFFATAEVISLLGAVPIFVDIEPHSFNIDVQQIEAAISPRTKAIMPVHLFGQPADMSAIQAIAKKHNLYVIEDVAQAFGATCDGRFLGTIGDVGAFSFFPSKNLGAYGDAGLIVTNDDNIAELVTMLRTHGSKVKYANEIVGYNSRLDSLQAAILRVKLPYVDDWNKQRWEIAARYHKALQNFDDIELPMLIEEHVFHQYTIRIKNRKRDAVKAGLASREVGTMIYYPKPVHKLPIYISRKIDMPQAEAAANEVLSLPIWPYLSQEKQDYVISALKEILGLLG